MNRKGGSARVPDAARRRPRRPPEVPSLGLCIGGLLLTGFDSLQFVSWVGACIFAGLAIRARIKAGLAEAQANKAKADQTPAA